MVMDTSNDKYKLTKTRDYEDKEGKTKDMESNSQASTTEPHINSYSELLLSVKNLVFRGAPGTEKRIFLSKLQRTLFLMEEQVR